MYRQIIFSAGVIFFFTLPSKELCLFFAIVQSEKWICRNDDLQGQKMPESPKFKAGNSKIKSKHEKKQLPEKRIFIDIAKIIKGKVNVKDNFCNLSI